MLAMLASTIVLVSIFERTAPPLDPPVAPAVSASNAFGIELFKHLAGAAPDGNLFVSPISMSIALTIAAEGARDETAEEMAAVLRFPTDGIAGSRGITAVHQGFTSILNRLASGQGKSDPGIEDRIASLRRQLQAANARTSELASKGEQWKEVNESQEEAERVASELNALLAAVDRFDLRIANALWVERAYPLAPAFTAEIDRHYGTGAARSLDFRGDPEKARRQINGWVMEQTEQRIADLIPPGVLTPEIGLVITNAIYFRGQWRVPFEEQQTRDEPFTSADGRTVDVRMMNDSWRGDGSYAAFTGTGEHFETPTEVPVEQSERPPTYPDDAGFQMLELPYKGGDLALVLLLPRTAQGLPALEAQLNAERLHAWLGQLAPRAVDASIPRFKLEFQAELSGALRALGMQRALTSPERIGGAQFSGMTTSAHLLHQLFIGAVIHKAWVEVNEKGTEAAAATAVIMPVAGSASAPPILVPFIPQVRANRPFLFLIRDTRIGVILFMGRVSNPA